MRPLLIFLLLASTNLLVAQCIQDISITITSINYTADCSSESSGLDPSFIVQLPNGSSFVSNYNNMRDHNIPGSNQMFIREPNCSGTHTFSLGSFDHTETSLAVPLEIFEKDSNIFNTRDCEYDAPRDDHYAMGNFIFDFSNAEGTMDVGSCISFNYSLEVIKGGVIEQQRNETLCPEETITINNKTYGINQATGQETLVGAPNECDTLITIDLSFYDVDPIDINGPDKFCPLSTAILSSSNNYATYLWNTGEDTKTIEITGPGNYSLTTTTNDGCVLEDSFIAETYPAAFLNIAGNTELCYDGTTELSIIANQVVWSTGETTNSITVSTAADYTVTVSDLNGCTATSSIQVTPLDELVIAITGNTNFCFGESSSIIATSGYSNYLWDNGETTEVRTVDQPGNYTITVTDNLGCTNSANISVSEYPQLIVDLTGTLELCPGAETILSIAQTFNNYSWSTNENSPMITVNEGGNYMVTVTDLNGCTATSAVIVVEISELEPTLIDTESFCESDFKILQLDQLYDNYLWSNGSTEETLTITEGGNYAVTVTDSNGCSGNTAATIMMIATITTNQEIITCNPALVGTAIDTNQTTIGCIEQTITTTILADENNCLLNIDLSAQATSCPDTADGVISITISNGNYPIRYLITDQGMIVRSGIFNSENDQTIEQLAAGAYQIELVSSEYFISQNNFVITSNNLALTLNNNLNLTQGGLTTLSAEIDTSELSSYYWSTDGNSLCSENCLTATVSPTITTSYLFLATTDSGCQYSDSLSVVVNDDQDLELYIPNTFSLSANSPNNSFKVFGASVNQIISITIYDRWGNIVYFQKAQEQKADWRWSGSNNQIKAEQGVYIYNILLGDTHDPRLKRGTITLWR